MTAFRLAILLALLGLSAAAGYVAISHWLAEQHLPPRPWNQRLRTMARELFWVLVSQPLLPVAYLVGHRFGGPRAGVPVVLVHGYFQNRVGFLRLGYRLVRARLGPVYAFNYPWLSGFEDNAERLRDYIACVCAETGASKVDLVCHSMGGLIARWCLRHRAPIRRIVTIGSPHVGVRYRGPVLGRSGLQLRQGSRAIASLSVERLRVPLLSLYSTHDNVVYPPSSPEFAALGGQEAEVGSVGHMALLFDPLVAEQTVGFLRATDLREARDSPSEAPQARAMMPGDMTDAQTVATSEDSSTDSGAPGATDAAPELAGGAAADAADALGVPERLAACRAAQALWQKVPLEERVRRVSAAASRVLARAEEIAKTLHEEMGKPEVEALLGEVIPSADVVTYWTTHIEELLEPHEVEIDKLAHPGKLGWIHREPRGVIALIQPWNFPVALPLRTIVPALLAGNGVMLKPSEITPRAGDIVGDIFAGLLPEGLLQIVQGDRDVGAELCQAGPDFVIFTGSVAAGRAVARACADKLIPCALELGGKDAAIVLADAPIARAAAGIVWGAMLNAGQNCGAVERVYVEESASKELLAALTEQVKALRLGTDVGRLATPAQRAIVERHVRDAKDKGARILVGGETDIDKCTFEPTLLEVTTDDLEIMREETFGPVLPVRVVKDAAEAVRLANASRFGLTASVWTKDVPRAQALAPQLRAGVVTINNHAFTGSIPGAPWSGVGESGWGVTNSPHSLDALTRPLFVLTDAGGAARELYWYPYTNTLRGVAMALIGLRGGAGFLGRIKGLLSLVSLLPRRLLGRDKGET
jgi:acyl-CoA reductase-like NAD-dependent aldehyde dehydrogenase/pimeloyl-ACP methyl ester carboxylesterase